eukprot:TRINITY_DN71406_c0_g1_i1.p1 TRINITY_DN71406_c0_g1~~TRINITY_DN71406_c0_g1_i1.p1  ORF type:complete len:345 (-),score=32.82 TRINITY_DN71406_c0_g1_i1:122-1156(-)
MGCTISVRFGVDARENNAKGRIRNSRDAGSTSPPVKAGSKPQRGSSATYLQTPQTSAARVIRHVEAITDRVDDDDLDEAEALTVGIEAAKGKDDEPLLIGADRKYLASEKDRKARKDSKLRSIRSDNDIIRDQSDVDYSRQTADRISLWLGKIDLIAGDDPVAAASKAQRHRRRSRDEGADRKKRGRHRVHLIDAESLQVEKDSSDCLSENSSECSSMDSDMKTARSSVSSQSTRSRKSCLSARSFGDRSSVLRNVSFNIPISALTATTADNEDDGPKSGKQNDSAAQTPVGASGPQANRRRQPQRFDADKSPRADIAEMLDNVPEAPRGSQLTVPAVRKNARD